MLPPARRHAWPAAGQAALLALGIVGARLSRSPGSLSQTIRLGARRTHDRAAVPGVQTRRDVLDPNIGNNAEALLPPPAHDAYNVLPDLAPSGVRTAWLAREAFYLPGLLGDAGDLRIFDQLVTELDFRSCWLNTGMKFDRNICIGSDDVVDSSPMYRAIIERLSKHFGVRVVRSLANFYRDGKDWCNLHADQYKQGNYPIDITVGASFGDERRIVFVENAPPQHQIHIPLRNGDVFAFSDAVNKRWKHKIPRGPPGTGPRISVIAWCTRQRDRSEAAGHGSSLNLGRFPHMLYYDPVRAGEAPPRRSFARHRRNNGMSRGAGLDGAVVRQRRWK